MAVETHLFQLTSLKDFCGSHEALISWRHLTADYFEKIYEPEVINFNQLWKLFSGKMHVDSKPHRIFFSPFDFIINIQLSMN